jgi:hypothetical protein
MIGALPVHLMRVVAETVTFTGEPESRAPNERLEVGTLKRQLLLERIVAETVMMALPAATAEPAETARSRVQKTKALIVVIRSFFMAPVVGVKHKGGALPPVVFS